MQRALKVQRTTTGTAGTSTVGSLVPQNPLQVGGPGFLHVRAGRLQGVGVLPFPPAEPDLKTQRTHT